MISIASRFDLTQKDVATATRTSPPPLYSAKAGGSIPGALSWKAHHQITRS
ncbi:hypothetical protein LNP74_28035 [Klebsiella pneumoniae subsp. pneumoniae]|nr:hypothetical protein [Klebsiella pneumoniae subsp. pneumoniae]